MSTELRPASRRFRNPTGSARHRPAVIAHRGASRQAPENTRLAFRLAVEAGSDMIETDAQLTRDGQIVLLHDGDLSRTTNCTGLVSDQRATDLSACDSGFWFAGDGGQLHPFRGLGLGVPTLADMFAAIDEVNPDVRVNIEIKNGPHDHGYDPDDRLATRLVCQLRALGVAERVILSSFNPSSIDRVKSIDASLRTAYLCAPWADLHGRMAYAVARGHDALHPHHALLGVGAAAQRTVELIGQAGLEVNVWTVNDPERMRELAAAGVDGIMSDDPELLRTVLESLTD